DERRAWVDADVALHGDRRVRAVAGPPSRDLDLLVGARAELSPAAQAPVRGAELLDPVAAPLGGVEAAARAGGDAEEELELALAGAEAPPLGEEVAVGGVLLDLDAVGDVDVAVRVGGDPHGADTVADVHEGRPLGEEVAVGVELLDPLVGGVGDVDVAGGIGGDGLGEEELPVAAAQDAVLAAAGADLERRRAVLDPPSPRAD